MSLKNQVILTGVVGKSPEKSYNNGVLTNLFSIAVHQSYRTGEKETVVETTWFDIITYDKLAEKTKFFKGNEHITLKGRLIRQRYKDKDNVIRFRIRIVAESILRINSL